MKSTLKALSLAALLALVSGAQAMMIEMPRATLDAGADVIVTGTVTKVTSSWNADNTTIYTDVTFSVEQTHKSAVLDVITVRVPGGEVDDIGMAVEDMPTFKAGDRAKLWLTRNGATFGLFGGLQGARGIIDGREVPLYSYTGYHRSPASCGYEINHAVPSDQSDAIQASDATWDVAGSAFRFGYLGTTVTSGTVYDGHNVISFGDLGNGGTIAQNTYWYNRRKIVLENDMVFNTYYPWSTSGEAGKMDVQNIATHELGHCLVLNDLYKAAQSAQTMYGYADYGQTNKQSLESGDVAGIKKIYGAGFDKAPTPRPAATD